VSQWLASKWDYSIFRLIFLRGDIMSKKTIGIQEILSTLPHKPPILLVEKVIEFNDEFIRAEKNVSVNEPLVQGHFPGHPIFPGLWTVEGMAQTSALLYYLHNPSQVGQKLPILSGVSDSRFKGMVKPGDRIVYEVKIEKVKMGKYFLSGKAYVDDKLIASAKFSGSFVNVDQVFG